MIDLLEAKWRTGRRVGRTVYAMVDDEPSEDDILIGMMDTKEIAEQAVFDHNTLMQYLKEGV